MSDPADEDVRDLGACCACGTTDPTHMIRNIVMLDCRAPVAGTGWGCLQCGLPRDGAMAVVCDRCLKRSDAITEVVVGDLAGTQRMPRAALPEVPFAHDMSKHPGEYAASAEEDPDDDPYEAEGEVYACQLCGTIAPRPAIVIFAGTSDDDPNMTATEVCAACFGFLGRFGVLGGSEMR